MKLYEEFKLYENMWDEESNTELKEAIDPIATLKAGEDTNTGWYTEYFAVGPAYWNTATGEVSTLEDFDYELSDDMSEYKIIPVVFGPHLHRTYSNERHDTLEDALDMVIDNLYSDSDLKSDISSHSDLFKVALMEPSITDNSATFVVAYSPDVQDDYGCFIRVSQKPLKSNKNLGKYYLNKPAAHAPHLLADLMDTGIIGEYSSEPNFDKSNYSWQAK